MSSCQRVLGILPKYLRHELPTENTVAVRSHLDACPECWNAWNQYRWNAAASHPLYQELRQYLGDDFRPYYDSSKALAAEWDAASPSTESETRAFYARSRGYLYNLTIWEASGNRPAYVREALPALRASHTQTIVDFGCGIGSDTIALQAHGFNVIPYELPSPHADFAAHRLQQRKQPTRIYDPSALHSLDPADALWIIDTLDHITDIPTALGDALLMVRIVLTEDLTTSREHGAQRMHIRRPYSLISSILATYGFRPSPQPSSTSVTTWRN